LSRLRSEAEGGDLLAELEYAMGRAVTTVEGLQPVIRDTLRAV
jgi:hypothetical protein